MILWFLLRFDAMYKLAILENRGELLESCYGSREELNQLKMK